MKNKLTAILLAAVMALGLTACGGNNPPLTIPVNDVDDPNEITQLYDYSAPQHQLYTAPETIETEEDMRTAWKAAIGRALEGGGTYNDIPVAAMTKGYLRKELEANGKKVLGYNLSTIRVDEDSYHLDAHHITTSETKAIYDVTVQFFGMDKADFDWSSIDDVNAHLSLGASRQVLGKTFDELYGCLGVTPIMIEYANQCKNSQFYWYENENAYWSVIFKDETDQWTGRTISFSMSRTEHGHEQAIHFISSEEYVSYVSYREDFRDEESMEKFAMFARQWQAEQNLVGRWEAVEMETDGQKTPVVPGQIYAVFEPDEKGVMNIPAEYDGETPFVWHTVRNEKADDGSEYIVFDFMPKKDGLLDFTMDMHYSADEETVTLFDEEQAYTITLKKVQ